VAYTRRTDQSGAVALVSGQGRAFYNGRLADLAPTLLMGLELPEMTGEV
jgi:hypothetical protein